MTPVSTIYDKEPFEREKEEGVNRPDPADRLINEKKDEALEKEKSE